MKQEEWKTVTNGFKISHSRYPIFSAKVENKTPPLTPRFIHWRKKQSYQITTAVDIKTVQNWYNHYRVLYSKDQIMSQKPITYSKLVTETQQKGLKNVQSQQ